MTTKTKTETLPSGTIFDRGSWQAALAQSAKLYDKSVGDRQKAGALLWQGATSAIADWASDKSRDKSGEDLYAEILGLLGESRKGDASKIKTVALAVRNKGLDLGLYNNLSKAYAEARRLTKTEQEERIEDTAAEQAIEAIEPPKTATTVEGAAKILFSKGMEGAIVALLDVLNGPSGEFNEAAARSFARSVTTEVAARVQAAKPKPEPRKKAEPKEGATKAPAKGAAKAKAEKADDKPKPARRKPVSANQNIGHTPATEATATEATATDAVEDDMFADVEVEETEGFTEAQQSAADTLAEKAAAKGVKPVKRPVRRPARRSA